MGDLRQIKKHASALLGGLGSDPDEVASSLAAAGVHGVGLLDWSGNLQLSGSILGAGGAAYAGNIHTTGSLTADSGVTSGSIGLTTHHHGGVTTGGGTTGAPTP